MIRPLSQTQLAAPLLESEADYERLQRPKKRRQALHVGSPLYHLVSELGRALLPPLMAPPRPSFECVFGCRVTDLTASGIHPAADSFY